MYPPKPRPSVVPSLEDRLQAEATDAAARAMVPRVKTYLEKNPSLQVRQLTIEHMRLLAGDVISAWVKKRAEQEFNDPVDDVGTENIFS